MERHPLPKGHCRRMKVAVMMGAESDKQKMAGAAEILGEFGVEVTEHVMSAHRTPDDVAAFASAARDNGYGAIICGAGMAAHLAGAVAARTTLPVIGVPLSGSALNGVDALYSTVMMPRGMPVATVAIDNAANAGLLAVAILAVTDEKLAGAPAEDATAVRTRAPEVTDEVVQAIADREAVTDHDVAAFVDVVQEAIGPPAGNWVHYGLTSSDVVDTALCATLTRAADLLIEASSHLVGTLKRRALEFRDTAMVGRTHGIHAEPT